MSELPRTTTPQGEFNHTDTSAASVWLDRWIVWLLLLVWSLVRVWIPGVNEPHYLCKAKHWWSPGWCDQDFFLTSSNPHLVFYVTFGWLTQFVSLPTTALIGRCVGLALLAIGLTAFVSTFITGRGPRLFACCLFLLFQAVGNFSGEWVVGGIESKVIAFGFGFWGLAAFCEGRFRFAGLLLGLAVSFHVLVGGWLSICVCGAAVLAPLVDRLRRVPRTDPHCPLDWKRPCIALAIWLLASLPGLIPALLIVFEPVDAYTKYAANYLQVFYRLKHHLDPLDFPPTAYLGYGLLALIAGAGSILLARSTPADSTQKAFRALGGLLLVSLLIAGVGFLLGLRFGAPADMPLFKLRLALLKFYPFRLFDVLAPLAAAVVVTPLLFAGLQRIAPPRWSAAVALVGWFVLWSSSLLIPTPDRDSSRMTASQKADWLELAAWIQQHTPEDAVVMTPSHAWAFQWYAERAEFVDRKDCPQDATGIVEWNNRLKHLKEWGQAAYADELYSAAETAQLARDTGITHIVVKRLGPFEQTPIYENRSYRLYKIGK